MRNSFLIPYILSFIAGIIIAGKIQLVNPVDVPESSVYIFLPLVLFLLCRKNQWVFILLFCVLGFYISQNYKHIESNHKPYKGVDIDLRVFESKPSQKGVSLYGRVIGSKNQNELQGKKIYIFLKTLNKEKFQKGDVLRCSRINLNLADASSLPFEFDFDRFLIQQDIHHKAYIYSETDIEYLGSIQSLNVFFDKINRKWQQAFSNAFQDDRTVAILSALSLGDKEKLDEQTKSVFADTGSMHILAVSGLHVGIIFILINRLTSFFFFHFKMKNVICWITGLIVIWVFTCITGSSPATVRAACMLSIFATGELIQGKTQILHTIAIVAFILLCLDPTLASKLSFQFSFIALCSIVIFQPLFQSIFLPKSKILSYFFQLLYLSFSVQILTLPFTLYYFHQFPLYFFLSGIIAVPFAGLLLSLLCIFILFSICFNWIPEILVKIIEQTTLLLHYSLEQISSLPFATVSIDRFYIHDFIAYFLLVITITKFFTGNFKLSKMRLVMMSLLSWFCAFLIQYWIQSTQHITIKKTIANTELYCIIKGRHATAIRPQKDQEARWNFTLVEIQRYYGLKEIQLIDQEEFKNSFPINDRELFLKSDALKKAGIWDNNRFLNYF